MQSPLVRFKRPRRASPDTEPLNQPNQRKLSLVNKGQGRRPRKTPTRAKLKQGFPPTSGNKLHIDNSPLQIPPSVYGNNLDGNSLEDKSGYVAMRHFRMFGVLVPSVNSENAYVESTCVATQTHKRVRRKIP